MSFAAAKGSYLTNLNLPSNSSCSIVRIIYLFVNHLHFPIAWAFRTRSMNSAR